MTYPDRPLIELDPQWITDNTGRVHGLQFRCPIHDKVPGNPDFDCEHHVGFNNPVDGGPRQAYWSIGWTRTGNTFETLALLPSIRINPNNRDGDVGCRWHGFVGGGAGEKPGIVVTLGDSL